MGNSESVHSIVSAFKEKENNKHESRKRNADIRKDEVKTRYAFEEKRMDLEHQHKIAELITQMKLTKSQAGKELVLAYMAMLTSIIQQNNTVFEKAVPLIQQISDGKTPDSIKKAAEKAIARAFDGYRSTQELLEFSKLEVERLNLKQNAEFLQLIDVAIEQKVITDENKIYILEEGI
ncbi:3845_t:CDS:2 [Ambispora gerdemannii]|uniref:3845_t:CDS:1 n=1 Tax=Ambispora gerdemannii TaxID=144530 RepID=A0A9N9BQ64_9GLOM|nr:3845_t:CDS:2 [Ambispora gerdemannii]